MTSVPLSKDVINWVIPTPTLSDLSHNSSDIDNDIDYVLNWLHPYFPPSLINQQQLQDNNWTQFSNSSHKLFNKVVEPSQRVRSAIRSCLKDDSNQLEFIKLYNNSITIKLNGFFDHLTSYSNLSFLDYFNLVKIIHAYYHSILQYLNVSTLSKDLFHRNLNSLFYNNLVNSPNSTFLSLLSNYLDDSLYSTELGFNSGYASSSTNDVIHTLTMINLVNEVNHIMIQLSIKKIKLFIIENCSRVWNKYLLELINQYIRHKIYPNFLISLKYSSTNIDSNSYLYDLIKIAHDELVSIRIKEIYDIILNFPTSSIALYELYQCFSIKFNHYNYNQQQHSNPLEDSNSSSTNLINDVSNLSNFSYLVNFSLKSQSYQRTKLVDNFIKLCHDKILHSGANTVDVITTYIKTIKSFLIIDPKGVLLDKVVRPIRMYLKTREDIILKIVQGLLEEDDSKNDLVELAQDLRKVDNPNKQQQINIDDGLDLNWIPDPIDALPDFKKAKVTDIIESLISIFDSNEIFISEFTKLFGQRLINIHDYNVQNIEDYLDLLKLRFGKNDFTSLDIMIKDIKESKIINQIIRIKSNSDNDVNFHTSILSHLYWPTIIENLSDDRDYFNVPPQIESAFKNVSTQFSHQKSGRGLKFLPSLGSVKLQLDFKNNITRDFEVSPDKASVIALFDDQNEELSVGFISKKLNMTSYNVSNALNFWVKEGVLIGLTKSLYVVNDDDDDDDDGGNSISANDELSINALRIKSATTDGPTSASSKSEESKAFDDIYLLWPHIQILLENISMLTSSKILALLKLRVPKDAFDVQALDPAYFEEYLDWLVEQEKLELEGNSFKLKH